MESPLSMTISTVSPLISPCSDKRVWSALQGRVEALLESRKPEFLSSVLPTDEYESNGAKRMKEDSMLLIRGFDSIASSLSQLTNDLDFALQGAKDLAKPSALTNGVHSGAINTEKPEDKQERESEKTEYGEEERKGVKRKLDECCSEEQEKDEDASKKENKQKNQAENNLKKVKNLAVSMAKKSASLARELKSVKSDMCFLQERCALLEAENQRLRDGFGEGIRPDEDDLVRLQLEALLTEKSRLATENANLTRENQCLRQLVEYHQFTSQDLSASYEQVIQGLCLDFSSPDAEDTSFDDLADPQTPTTTTGDSEFHTPLLENSAGEQKLLEN